MCLHKITNKQRLAIYLWGSLCGSLWSVSTLAELTFVDGGYAELCSSAAFRAELAERIVLTGSRLGLEPVDVCTLATNSPDGAQSSVAGSYNNRGVLLFTQKDFPEALADFDMAIQLEPGLGLLYVNRGYTLTAMQRWEESIAAYTSGIELVAPELDKAYFNRAIAHEELGNIRQAYQDYKKAAELNPAWEEPRAELARFNVQAKN